MNAQPPVEPAGLIPETPPVAAAEARAVAPLLVDEDRLRLKALR